MHVEQSDVDDDGEGDEAHGPGQEVLDGVGEGLGHVAEDLPELVDGVQAHQEDDEQTDKFDRYCAA